MTKQKSVGAVIIQTLNQLGVEHFYATPGSEFGPIILEFAENEKNLKIKPQLCAHEFLAVSMAYGSYFRTKKPQSLMVHANVGLANALIGLIGAHRMNVPMIFIAGQTSQVERSEVSARDRVIHWSQDSQHPTGPVGDYVKSTLTIQHESQVVDVVHRAYQLSITEPMGPVAIFVSRDVLERRFLFEENSLQNLEAEVYSAGLSVQSVRRLSALLAQSHFPLLISNRFEGDHRRVPAYAQALNKHAIACLRPENFYQVGAYFDETDLTDQKKEALNEADLIFVLDTDVPWFPLDELQNRNVRVVHIGSDPLFSALPVRSHRCDLLITASCDAFFQFLESEKASNVDQRMEMIASKKKTARTRLWNPEQSCTTQTVAEDLSELMPRYSVLVNELSLPQEYLHLKDDHFYFRSGASSPLGWGIGFCLGHASGKSNTEQIHYCVVGDGVFHLSPVCSLMTAAENHIPLVLVVLNNGKMQSVVSAVEKYSGQKRREWPLTSFGNGFRYENVALMIDGFGAKVQNRAQFRDALHHATDFTRVQGRPAIINVEISA